MIYWQGETVYRVRYCFRIDYRMLLCPVFNSCDKSAVLKHVVSDSRMTHFRCINFRIFCWVYLYTLLSRCIMTKTMSQASRCLSWICNVNTDGATTSGKEWRDEGHGLKENSVFSHLIFVTKIQFLKWLSFWYHRDLLWILIVVVSSECVQ